MATIKSYTDIEQSKKLAEILPLESADMHYQYVLPKSSKIKHNPEIGNPINALEWYNKGYTTSGKEPITLDEYCVPCWSLTTLLNVIPKRIKEYNVLRMDIDEKDFSIWYDEVGCGVNIELPDIAMECPIDACVEMILKLHELNLL